MITSEQFDEALKIIIDYKTQVESKNTNNKLDIIFVDIQKYFHKYLFCTSDLF